MPIGKPGPAMRWCRVWGFAMLPYCLRCGLQAHGVLKLMNATNIIPFCRSKSTQIFMGGSSTGQQWSDLLQHILQPCKMMCTGVQRNALQEVIA